MAMIFRGPEFGARFLLLIGLLSGLAVCPLAGSAEPSLKVPPAEWPQFRGLDGQGHADAKGLALNWSEKENIAWKAEVPGLGWSSPVIQGQQIWLTTCLDEPPALRAVCFERTTGRKVHDVEVFAPKKLIERHTKNSCASPGLVIEGDRVYVHFGPMGTACLSTEGKVLWTTTLPHTLSYGPSSSPVLFDDLLIVTCQGTDVRYTVALDKHTGKERWKTSRDGRNSESTPLLIRAGNADQLVCNLADWVVAYDPRTGKELWSVQQGDNFAQVPRPVYGNGLVFVGGGYYHPVLQAIRPDGRGDVSKSHVVWKLEKHVPQNPSPLLVGNELYLVNDSGIASCVDARTGKVHWTERLGGAYSASPLLADGRIYFSSEDGVTTVISPGATFQKMATNRVEGRLLASLAVAGKEIYLRTDHHLYRIETK
jgi:outer membrane protein assembly factor BamB